MRYFYFIIISTLLSCNKDDDSSQWKPQILNTQISSVTSEQPNDALFLPSGNIGVIVTRKNIGLNIMKLNPIDGNFISSEPIINQPSLFARDLYQEGNSYSILADFELMSNFRNIKFLTLNSSMMLESEKTISSLHHEVGVKMIKANNGNYALLVNRKRTDSNTWGFLIYEINASGTLNSYEFPHPILQSASDMIRKQDGTGYYVFAHVVEDPLRSTDYVLYEFDNVFNVVKKKYFGGVEYEEARQVLEDNSGRVYLFGHSASTDILHEMNLIKLDSELNMIYDKHYGSEYHDGGQTMCFDGGSRLTLIGRTNAPSNTNEGIYYLKINTEGGVLDKQYLGNEYSNRSNIVLNRNGEDFIIGYTEIDNNFTKNIDFYKITYPN